MWRISRAATPIRRYMETVRIDLTSPCRGSSARMAPQPINSVSCHMVQRDVRFPQCLEVECMNAFGRRMQRHALQVLAQQLGDLRAAQIVDSNVHASSRRARAHRVLDVCDEGRITHLRLLELELAWNKLFEQSNPGAEENGSREARRLQWWRSGIACVRRHQCSSFTTMFAFVAGTNSSSYLASRSTIASLLDRCGLVTYTEKSGTRLMRFINWSIA